VEVSKAIGPWSYDPRALDRPAATLVLAGLPVSLADVDQDQACAEAMDSLIQRFVGSEDPTLPRPFLRDVGGL
jgi:hypothetical protein